MLENKKIVKRILKNPNRLPSDKAQHYLDLDTKYINPVLSRYNDIVAVRGKGSYLYDINGEAYLDLSSGIAVNNLGHCHPAVVAAIQEQAAELIHTSVTAHHIKYIELAQKLAEISPGNLDSVFLSNSGTESVEGAIKLARYITGRPAIINFQGSFHGRTLMSVALTTSKLYYRERLEPLPGPIYTAPFPYMHRSAFKDDPEACLKDAIHQLRSLLHHSVHPSQVAAMIIEPIQGEGGYVVPPMGFLAQLKEIASSHGILLIADEVQSGFCRSGKMFAIEHENVVPDIMIMAKGIAAGMPLSAIIAPVSLTSQWLEARHGSTFGGNPISCAAALASIRVMQEEKLDKRAEKLGNEMLKRLQKFANGKQHIGEIRGRGLMIGIDFDQPDGSPGKSIAKHIMQRCLENNLIVLNCGEHGQVIRLIPSLTISDSELEKACEILEKCMDIKEGDVIHEHHS
jgi:4-aminobutyrate aminotransferase